MARVASSLSIVYDVWRCGMLAVSVFTQARAGSVPDDAASSATLVEEVKSSS